MPPAPVVVSLRAARRLAVHAALLDTRLPATADGILRVVEGLGRLQLDPTRAVERSHLLVLWSRLGPFDRARLDRLLWEQRRLIEYDAFIYPTAEYPMVRLRMNLFATRDAALERRAREWLAANGAFRGLILARLRREGPLPSRAFTAPDDVVAWKSGGWTAGRNVHQMFHFMERSGEVMVSARDGNQRLWDLPDRVLPEGTPRQEPASEGLLERLIEQRVRHFGVVEPAVVPAWISTADRASTRAAMRRMIDEGRLRRVVVDGAPFSDGALVHADDMQIMDRLGASRGWQPRLTLLSPFDPLITDRDRTQRLFGFRFRLDIYRPAAQRQHGYFVMPILHGDRLIGRLEPVVDRRAGTLEVRHLALEPGVSRPPAGLDDAVRSLRAFVGAAA